MTLPEHPLLAPWYRLVEDGDRLLLEHGRTVVVLEGGAVRTLLPELLPLLDGSRSPGELGDALGVAVRPAVERTLELLAANGLLVEGGAAGEAGAPAIAAAYRLSPADAGRRLRQARVGVVGDSSLGEDVARLLRRAGLGTVERLEWEPPHVVELAVVAPGRTEAAALDGWNALALEREMRWLGIRPFDGASATVGPLVVPGESPCHTCLLLRLAGHVEYGEDFSRVEAAPLGVEAGAPLEAFVAALTAHLVLAWVGGRDTRLPGLVHVLESGPPLSLSAHRVLRVPRCPACSPAERLAPPIPWHEAEAA